METQGEVIRRGVEMGGRAVTIVRRRAMAGVATPRASVAEVTTGPRSYVEVIIRPLASACHPQANAVPMTVPPDILALDDRIRTYVHEHARHSREIVSIRIVEDLGGVLVMCTRDTAEQLGRLVQGTVERFRRRR